MTEQEKNVIAEKEAQQQDLAALIKELPVGGNIGTAAYPPEVTVRNNIVPPLEELRNCTTCHYGRPLPADAMSPDDYHYHCSQMVGGGHQHVGIGLKHYDNECETFLRKRSDLV
jgi:hypothetical protein